MLVIEWPTLLSSSGRTAITSQLHLTAGQRAQMWTTPSYQKIRLGFEVTMSLSGRLSLT